MPYVKANSFFSAFSSLLVLFGASLNGLHLAAHAVAPPCCQTEDSHSDGASSTSQQVEAPCLICDLIATTTHNGMLSVDASQADIGPAVSLQWVAPQHVVVDHHLSSLVSRAPPFTL